MSEAPFPELVVPTAASKFNDPAGNGFVRWFSNLRTGVNVLAQEVFGRAVATAQQQTDAGVAVAKKYADTTAEGFKQYTDTAIDTTLSLSGIALDTDGTPYFEPSSMSPRVFADTDGNPYFREL